MPFTVTVDEIIDFFYGYQVLPGSVCLQFNEKGLPTGEAMVAFDSHDEAMAAVMDLNDRPIGAKKSSDHFGVKATSSSCKVSYLLTRFSGKCPDTVVLCTEIEIDKY